ncbi:MAG: hypothetical protein IPM47_11100 [Sphingobacteriales bacterium]|nr:MAG: hypothetical protein IPM47_11100 [Sphingobacteriales bacterium]
MQRLHQQIDKIISQMTAMLEDYIQLEQAFLLLSDERNHLTKQLEEQKKTIQHLQQQIAQLGNPEIEVETINSKRKREHLKAAINDVIKEVDKCLNTLDT